MASRRTQSPDGNASLGETLTSAGWEPDTAQMLDQMPHRVVRVEPRRPFREAGSPSDEIIFVRSGIVAQFKTDSSGRRQIVALRFPGEAILPHPGPAHHGIQAIVRSEVLIGKARDLEQLLEANPALQRHLHHLLQRDQSIAFEWLVNCGRRDSTARVAHLFCETAARMHVRNGHMINPFTQQQIADITGQTSVNVNRVLADLERQGLIRRKGREIEFTDWAEMRRLASFQPAYLE
jgi:CRP-like cAMP-binding protein